MPQEQLFCVGCEVVACLAGCVELGKEGECLPSHRLLDQDGWRSRLWRDTSSSRSVSASVRRLESTWQGPERRPPCRSAPGAAYVPDVSPWPLPTGSTGQLTCLLGLLLCRNTWPGCASAGSSRASRGPASSPANASVGTAGRSNGRSLGSSLPPPHRPIRTKGLALPRLPRLGRRPDLLQEARETCHVRHPLNRTDLGRFAGAPCSPEVTGKNLAPAAFSGLLTLARGVGRRRPDAGRQRNDRKKARMSSVNRSGSSIAAK